VTIEKAFAIKAPPRRIYDAIERDLASAAQYEGDTYEVTERAPPRSIALRVTIGGVPCRLRYRITETPDHSEVTGELEPYGWKHVAFKIMTLGLREQNYAIVLTQALVNLKEAVEAESSAFPDEGSMLSTPSEE
jgi:hypothetical protein